ncbi:Transposon Ty3-G Gag-Pol polyprotein [Senna tora]|uniref:Transposon Ty3-G Gag-Pol polyprotein n=1 Tax=Senna tora TaxID=362788 RepID=A0A834T046_9FABA|nr:Transposon Ty3-G Gag-Pol polyprotein [Senna tora]
MDSQGIWVFWKHKFFRVCYPSCLPADFHMFLGSGVARYQRATLAPCQRPSQKQGFSISAAHCQLSDYRSVFFLLLSCTLPGCKNLHSTIVQGCFGYFAFVNHAASVHTLHPASVTTKSGRDTKSLREAESISQHPMLQEVVADLAKLFEVVERLSTQQTQPKKLAMASVSCSHCGSLMHLTTNCPSKFHEVLGFYQQRPEQSQSLVPYSSSDSKCWGNNSQCNYGFQGASSSLKVHSPSSQDDSSTMITPYEQDSSPKKNDVQLLLEGMVDLEASMKNQMATMENRIVDFGKQYSRIARVLSLCSSTLLPASNPALSPA